MKTYLVTTGLLFGLMAAVHVCKAVAEWPHDGLNAGYALGMTALIAIPAALALWAWRLWRKAGKIGQ